MIDILELHKRLSGMFALLFIIILSFIGAWTISIYVHELMHIIWDFGNDPVKAICFDMSKNSNGIAYTVIDQTPTNDEIHYTIYYIEGAIFTSLCFLIPYAFSKIKSILIADEKERVIG